MASELKPCPFCTHFAELKGTSLLHRGASPKDTKRGYQSMEPKGGTE